MAGKDRIFIKQNLRRAFTGARPGYRMPRGGFRGVGGLGVAVGLVILTSPSVANAGATIDDRYYAKAALINFDNELDKSTCPNEELWRIVGTLNRCVEFASSTFPTDWKLAESCADYALAALKKCDCNCDK